MNKIYENIRIEPMIANSNTAAVTSIRKIKWIDDQSMLFYFRIGGASPTGTAMSATTANICQMSLTESTASSHAGSVITGATMTLGAATAYKPLHAESLILTITSAIGSAASFIVNGQGFHCGTVDAGTTGEGCASALAVAINGGGTQEKLKHYSAIGNFTDTGIILIYPDDGQGTGLTCTVANATDFKTRAPAFTGCIELKAESLSTNRPKWIGVTLTTEAAASFVRTVDCIRIPRYKPAFGGVTTYV